MWYDYYYFIRVHYLQIRTQCGCTSTNCNSNTSSTTKEVVTASLADASPSVTANFNSQAGIPSLTLGLRESTYYPSINLCVLLMQYGTLCQARISCLGSYYQRGKIPHVYSLATWQRKCNGFFLFPAGAITLHETLAR